MEPFDHTHSVSLELSNSCSHAWLHEKCPLHSEMLGPGVNKEPKTLPIAIVRKVLETLGEYEYNGTLAFHQYNEPLQDPRLFLFLAMAKEMCQYAGPYIVTNGYNLTPTLAEELLDYGVRKIIVSALDDRVVERRVEVLREWVDSERIEVYHPRTLDDRLLVYDVPKPWPDEPCHAPLSQIIITRDAKVGLCCFDWKRLYTFGDLREEKLDAILRSDEVQQTYEDLSHNKRTRFLCRQCGRSR